MLLPNKIKKTHKKPRLKKLHFFLNETFQNLRKKRAKINIRKSIEGQWCKRKRNPREMAKAIKAKQMGSEL